MQLIAVDLQAFRVATATMMVHSATVAEMWSGGVLKNIRVGRGELFIFRKHRFIQFNHSFLLHAISHDHI